MTNKSTFRDLFFIDDPIERFVTSLCDIYVNVKTFYFIVYAPWVSNVEKRFRKEEKDEREINPTHFGETKWDFERSLILNIAQGHRLQNVIEKLLLHDEKSENDKLIPVPRNDVKEWFFLRRKQIAPDETIGLTSLCETLDGNFVHIPMMDFSCPVSDRNVLFIHSSLQKMGFNSGIIVNSGRSYHFYGQELCNHLGWIKFMGRCLLLSPYADSRYIAHRLIAGRCILRVGKSRTKPEVPTIVNVF
jgi:hypothetical protein